MLIAANNKTGIGADGTIYKFIIIGVGGYQIPMEINFNCVGMSAEMIAFTTSFANETE